MNRDKKYNSNEIDNFWQKSLSSEGGILTSTFCMIKKSTVEGVFEYLYSDPQLNQNLKLKGTWHPGGKKVSLLF